MIGRLEYAFSYKSYCKNCLLRGKIICNNNMVLKLF